MNDEHLIPLAKAARLVPSRSGRGVHVATIWRWTERGVGGHVLRSCKVGGQRFTNQESLDQFVAACSGESGTSSVPSNKSRKKIETDQAKCEAIGIA